MRPSVDEYFLDMARLASTRSTCFRRNVGCILVNSRNRVLATGYNGVASGQPHCNFEDPDQSYVKLVGQFAPLEVPIRHPYLCDGANSPSGTDLNRCKAIHAEMNALVSCGNPEDIFACYVTASPCIQCVRSLINTPCKRIVFEEVYPHPEAECEWKDSEIVHGRTWVHFIRTR